MPEIQACVIYSIACVSGSKTREVKIALVAQMVEHGTFNAGVLGSIPNERILDECYPRATAI